MEEKDRPKVEIDATDLSSTCSYASPTSIPKYLIDRTYAPRCLAEAVSEKGDITLEEFAKIVKKPRKKTLGLVRESLGNGSYKVYLPVDKANRTIVERPDNSHSINFLFEPIGIEQETYILNGDMYHDIGTFGSGVRQYVGDIKSHTFLR